MHSPEPLVKDFLIRDFLIRNFLNRIPVSQNRPGYRFMINFNA